PMVLPSWAAHHWPSMYIFRKVAVAVAMNLPLREAVGWVVLLVIVRRAALKTRAGRDCGPALLRVGDLPDHRLPTRPGLVPRVARDGVALHDPAELTVLLVHLEVELVAVELPGRVAILPVLVGIEQHAVRLEDEADEVLAVLPFPGGAGQIEHLGWPIGGAL